MTTCGFALRLAGGRGARATDNPAVSEWFAEALPDAARSAPVTGRAYLTSGDIAGMRRGAAISWGVELFAARIH